MRRILIAIFLLAAASGVQAADVGFVHVWPMWRDADSFMKISEYFTGREPPGDSVVLRTHPAYRAGYYFVTRIKHPKTALTGTKFVLHIIMPTSPVPKIFIFPGNAPRGTNLFELGLTGADWPVHGPRPVAWMLELVSADGHQLASRESYLWSKPDKVPLPPLAPTPDDEPAPAASAPPKKSH